MKIEVTQCSMCKHYSEEQYCEIWQQYITNDAFYCACGVKADRKTENCSEKPNNCKDLQDWKDRMWAEAIVTEPQTSCKTCRYGEVDEGYVRCAYYSKSTEQDEPQTEVVMPYERMRGLYTGYRKTEPTISKMEQVEDEPQTERSE